MTDINEVKQHISDWVNNILMVPNSGYGGFPICPFSKKALEDGQIQILYFEELDISQVVTEMAKTWNDDVDMSLLCTNLNKINYHEANDALQELNRTILAQNKLSSFFEHPVFFDEGSPRRSGVSNGKYAIVYVFKVEKLIEAQAQLSKLGYYKDWSDEELTQTTAWRHDVLIGLLKQKSVEIIGMNKWVK